MGHSSDTDKDIVYDFPFTVAPALQLVSAATFSNRLETPSYIIDVTTPGANKIAEYACMTHDSDAFWEVKQYRNSDLVLSNNSYVEQIECFLGCFTSRSNLASLTATDYTGIEYGSIDTAPPFSAPAAGGVAQLRWVASTDSFELFTAKGDGTAGVVVPLIGVTNTADSSTIPHGVFAMLEIDNPRRIVRAYINGILGATYQGDAFPSEPLNHTNGAHQLVSGIFLTTGTVTPVGGRKAYISNFKHRLKGAKNFPSSSIGEQVPR